MSCCSEKWNDYFQINGNKWLVSLTLVEVSVFIAYVVLFFLIHKDDGSIGQVMVYQVT
jgi:hypothetical protein